MGCMLGGKENDTEYLDETLALVLVIAAKLAQSIGNQPRIGRSGIAKRGVCLLIWHCLTSEDAGHCNASLLPRELLKHFTGASQGLLEVTETRASGSYAAIGFSAVTQPFAPLLLSIRPKTGCLLLGWRNACVERSWPPSGNESGDAMPRNRRNGSMGGDGSIAHLRPKSWARDKTPSRPPLPPLPPQIPPAVVPLRLITKRTRCTTVFQMPQKRDWHYVKAISAQINVRLRFSVSASRAGKFDGTSDSWARPSRTIASMSHGCIGKNDNPLPFIRMAEKAG